MRDAEEPSRILSSNLEARAAAASQVKLTPLSGDLSEELSSAADLQLFRAPGDKERTREEFVCVEIWLLTSRKS